VAVSGAQAHATPQSQSVPQAHCALGSAVRAEAQAQVCEGVQVQGWQLH